MIRICVVVKLPGHSVNICRIFARSVNKGEALVLKVESHSLESVVQNGRGEDRCTRFMICIDCNVCTIRVKLKMFKELQQLQGSPVQLWNIFSLLPAAV